MEKKSIPLSEIPIVVVYANEDPPKYKLEPSHWWCGGHFGDNGEDE